MMDRIQAALLAHSPYRARAIDIVYNELDDLLLARRFDEANAGLLAIATSDLPLSLLLSALIVSLPWKAETREARRELSKKAQELAIAKGDNALRCMEGLLDD